MDIFKKGVVLNAIIHRSQYASEIGAMYDKLMDIKNSDGTMAAYLPLGGDFGSYRLRLLDVKIVEVKGDALHADGLVFYAQPTMFELHIKGEII